MNISLKIPPLLLTLLLGALMWLVSLYTPALPLPDGFRVYGLSVFSGFAIFYMLPALLAFKRQQKGLIFLPRHCRSVLYFASYGVTGGCADTRQHAPLRAFFHCPNM